MTSNIQSKDFPGGGEALKAFQLTELDAKSKSDPAVGKKLAAYIASTVFGSTQGYYFSRNTRFQRNRNYANGKIDMTKFQDLLNFNGKTNYVNINWQSIKIVTRIIAGLVGRWMERMEKITVQCTDSLSVSEKQDEYENLEFQIANKKKLEELQASSGVPMIPNEPIPADQEELNLWVAQFQRIPEEILYEIGCNNTLRASGWFETLKRKMLHDSAEVGLVGTYTWMDKEGVVHVDWVKPENMLYSYSEYPDFRDTSWRGQVKALKVSELRKRYGKQFGGKLPEEEIWKLAQSARDYQYNDKLRWLTDWNVAYMRPYDEWSLDIMYFELKTVDKDGYTETTTKQNKSTILQKGAPPKLKENQAYLEDESWCIYEGVYERNSGTLLQWNMKKNMIRPQDPKEIGNCEFSYSFYMYNNYQMRNIAVPEKIEEPADQMILARLKMQQLVSKMRPVGAAINEEALQNIDYGLGDSNKTIDHKKLYDQTGDIYYRGTDAEGKQVPVPITELQNSGFLPQMEALIKLYSFHYQVLKDELGEDPNLTQQALTPRVTTGNVDNAQQSADNATDYMYDAYISCMKDTARKIACLMKASVDYGSAAYRDLLNKFGMDRENLETRRFNTDIQMMPNAQEMAKFENFLNTAITASPELITYLDPFQILRVAKENVKLAELYMRNAQKKMYLGEMQKAQANSQQQAQVQMQAAQAAEQAKQQTVQLEGQTAILKATTTGEAQSKNTVLAGIMSMYVESMKSGAQIPSEMKALSEIVLKNVALPAMAENREILEQMQASMQEAAGGNQNVPRGTMQQEPAPEEQGQGQEQAQEQQIQQPQAA